jgi:hypothetical protein
MPVYLYAAVLYPIRFVQWCDLESFRFPVRLLLNWPTEERI